jgi:hypothetical protein
MPPHGRHGRRQRASARRRRILRREGLHGVPHVCARGDRDHADRGQRHPEERAIARLFGRGRRRALGLEHVLCRPGRPLGARAGRPTWLPPHHPAAGRAAAARAIRAQAPARATPRAEPPGLPVALRDPDWRASFSCSGALRTRRAAGSIGDPRRGRLRAPRAWARRAASRRAPSGGLLSSQRALPMGCGVVEELVARQVAAVAGEVAVDAGVRRITLGRRKITSSRLLDVSVAIAHPSPTNGMRGQQRDAVSEPSNLSCISPPRNRRAAARDPQHALELARANDRA